LPGGQTFVLPLVLLRHPNYRRLSPFGHKLIIDLACQFTGFNNGFLCTSFSLLKDQGWNSPMTLYKASCEIEHYRLIEKTQQGGMNKPNLYAFTWRRIDEVKGRALDVQPTLQPSHAWKDEQPDFVFKPKTRAKKQRPKAMRKAA
jgi:hypothetical protein